MKRYINTDRVLEVLRGAGSTAQGVGARRHVDVVRVNVSTLAVHGIKEVRTKGIGCRLFILASREVAMA